MNWLLIIVVGILLVGVLVGFVRGGVRIAVSLVATLFTIAVVFVATPYVSKSFPLLRWMKCWKNNAFILLQN